MKLIQKIFGDKDQRTHDKTVAVPRKRIAEKIANIPDTDIRTFLAIVLAASEQVLRALVFNSPDEFDLRKEISSEEADSWLTKCSAALTAYSYYSTEGWYWQSIRDSIRQKYRNVFGEPMNLAVVNHYAAGLKEDIEEGYSVSGDLEKTIELAKKDSATIAAELLESVWGEQISAKVMAEIESYQYTAESGEFSPMARRIVFVGTKIWQAHEQIVQPVLAELSSR